MLVSVGSDKTQNIDVSDLTRELPRTVVRRRTRRVAIGALGGGLTATGVAGVLVPVFPGAPLILVGLAVLAREFHWARRIQANIRSRIRHAGRRSGRSR
jgi:hypothetical protein